MFEASPGRGVHKAIKEDVLVMMFRRFPISLELKGPARYLMLSYTVGTTVNDANPTEVKQTCGHIKEVIPYTSLV